MNPTKIDQYQDYHQILNRQPKLSSIPQYNEINKNTTISVASKNDEIYLQVPSDPINDSLSTVTPGDLINCFRKLNKQTINSLEDLVHYIHDVSISLGSPFVSVKTGPTRKIQQFACQFHNSNYQCKALVSYYYDKETNTIFLEEMCNQHTHPISEILPTKSRNTLTYLQRSRIQIATQEGFKATTIKRKENLVCSKDVLYASRRRILKELREDEIKILLAIMCDYNNWTNGIFIDETNKFVCCFSLHNHMLNCPYARDIVIIDDTSCTNFYGKPLITMIVEDENGKNQVLSFGIMEDRCKNSFRIYFSNVKKLIGDIEVFVTDRNFTQIDAVCELWPNAIIIYCTRHIGKNIKDKVSKEMYEEFQKMLHNKKTEEELLKDFRDYIVAHQDTQASNVLQGLLDSTEHWLSSITSKYMHRGNSTSNRVEGFFGSFKNFTDHDILSLGELVKTIYIYCRKPICYIKILMSKRTSQRSLAQP